MRFWAEQVDLDPVELGQGIAYALKDPVSLLDSKVLNPPAYPNGHNFLVKFIEEEIKRRRVGDVDLPYAFTPKYQSLGGILGSPFADMDVFVEGNRNPLPEKYPLCRGNGLDWSGTLMGYEILRLGREERIVGRQYGCNYA